jgi:hypothetical protein
VPSWQNKILILFSEMVFRDSLTNVLLSWTNIIMTPMIYRDHSILVGYLNLGFDHSLVKVFLKCTNSIIECVFHVSASRTFEFWKRKNEMHPSY